MELTDKEQRHVNKSLRILEKHLSQNVFTIKSSEAAIDFLKLKIGMRENEVFSVLYLDQTFKLIEYQEVFYGTVNSTEVHPRIIAQQALKLNASAIILAHNHPSGVAAISENDKAVTQSIVEVMRLIDVAIIDHIIIAGNTSTSFAEAEIPLWIPKQDESP